MKNAFTLIELLVVVTILTLVMAVVVPKGAKLLSSYENSLEQIQLKHKLSKEKSLAFLSVQERNITIEGKNIHITKKGYVLE